MIGLVIDGAVVFALMVALDFVWARYTIALQTQKHGRASLHAGLIFMLNGVVTLAYVGSPLLLVPAVLGAVLGTYAGSRISRVNTP